MPYVVYLRIFNWTRNMKIQFDKQFKKGDIICSDNFHSSKCMIVNNLIIHERAYNCDDLILKKQGWYAIEFDTFNEYPYNWRLATDDDICKYIDNFLDIRVEEFEGLKVEHNSIGITIGEFFNTMYLDVEQATKLRDYLNKYVIGG